MNTNFLTPDYLPDQSRRERSMSAVEGVTYEELKQILAQEQKIRNKKQEQLLRSSFEFEKFNELYEKQSVYLQNMEKKAEEELQYYIKEKEILQSKNRDLVELVKIITEKVQKMLGVKQQLRGRSQTTFTFCQSPLKKQHLLSSFLNLQKQWQFNQTMLKSHEQSFNQSKNQITRLQGQIRILSDKLKASEADSSKIKQRVKMIQLIVQQAQNDKQRMNQQIFKERQCKQTSSQSDLRKIISHLRIEQRQLKLKNHELTLQIQRIIHAFDDKIGNVFTKIDRIENLNKKGNPQLNHA